MEKPNAVIWKYPLTITDEQVLQLPSSHRVLSVHRRGVEQLCLWALVDPTPGPLHPVCILLVGAGQKTLFMAPDAVSRIPMYREDGTPFRFLNTVLLYDGALVLHAFCEEW